MYLTTATPREIDQKLADLYESLNGQYRIQRSAFDSMHRMLGETPKCDRSGNIVSWPTGDDDVAARLRNATITSYEERRRGEILTSITNATHEIMQLALQISELDREFQSRGRWTRFFTVEDGHIHSARHCKGGTIRATTRVGWNPELSSKTEREAVALLGPNLCTHCYPSAPVEWTRGTEKKIAEGYCEGQGSYGENLQMQYVTPRGSCPVCKQGTGISKTGKVLKHKQPAS